MQILEFRLTEQASVEKKTETGSCRRDTGQDRRIPKKTGNPESGSAEQESITSRAGRFGKIRPESGSTDHGSGKTSTGSPGSRGVLLQKGRLILPVTGKIVSRFGIKQSGDYKSFTFQSGIDIRGDQGEPVRSVFRGEVVFAKWLKGYGNMAIIDHGDHFYTVYAHLQEIFRKKGDAVDTGEVIATLGDTGSLKGVCLHFELRHHGQPVDPVEWLKKGA